MQMRMACRSTLYKCFPAPCPQIRAQQVIAADIDTLEERMWHDVNEYQLSLQQHLSDRDGLLNRIDRASQQLLLLKVRRPHTAAAPVPVLC